MYAILNHYTRNPSPIVDALKAQGVEPIVFTDTTNYYQNRNSPDRYIGLNENYYRILSHQTTDKWKIIMHDDISISPELVAKIEYILQFAPATGISFYCPTNSGYKKATEAGKHVLTAFNNIWFPCHAIPTEMGYEIEAWMREHAKPWGLVSEDRLMSQWQIRHDEPFFAVLPSLVQHDGYAKSTFKNPAKVGKYFRYSELYNPSFDVTQVNWAEEFANPYPEGTKKWDNLGIDGVTKDNKNG